MKGTTSRLLALLALILTVLFTSIAPARAALQATGPTDLATGFPTWYQDGSGLAVQECLDLPSTTGNVPYCTLLAAPGFNPLLPIVGLPTLSNYPTEMFYWVADNKFNTVPGVAGAIAALRIGLEATFALGTPQVNQQITFLLVNLQKMSGLPPNSTYTVTHPFGSFAFTTDATGNTPPVNGQAFRARDAQVPIPLSFNDLLPAPTTSIGPLLKASATPGGAALPFILDPVSGNTYLANPLLPTAVTGGINGNIVTITGPGIGGPGVNSVSSSLWNLQGKVFLGQIPSPLTLDRTTYARDAASGQIDLFATALPNAILSVSGTGITTTSMTQAVPNSGKFFAHIPFGATLPSALNVTSSLDVPPVNHPVTLVDEVNISQASFDPVAKTLTIKADSRDNVAPLPVLTVPQFAAPNTLDATGTLVLNLATTIPPETVTVSSSKGGSATALVSVVTPPPLAVNDTAVVGAGGSVVINVLANDSATAPATLTASSVAIAGAPARGTAAVNAVTGAITYTPTGLTAGTDSFTYTVTDSNLKVSNPATVTIVIVAQGAAPVALNDTASTTPGGIVTINLIGNDTAALPAALNPASLVLTATNGGTALINANGTVTYTAPATAGIYNFAYTVKDNAIPPATSNPAMVTVTVAAAAPAPVAVNDAATTTAGTAVAINVLANDTIAAPGVINPASVAIATAPLATQGTAAVNATTGAITFTPAAGFTGTATFTYTVKNSSVPALTSNAATVTVTVNPAGAIFSGLSILLNGGAAATNSTSVTATLAATSSAGAVTQMQFSKDGGVTYFGLEAFATTRANISLVGGQGINTIFVRFKDAAGNLSPAVSDSILLDQTAPTGTIAVTSPNPTTLTTGTLGLTATDNVGGSGVTNMQFSRDGGVTWFALETFATTRTVSLNIGVNTFTVRFRDAAGNFSANQTTSITRN